MKVADTPTVRSKNAECWPAVLFCVPGLVVHCFSVIDAYQTAERLKRGETIRFLVRNSGKVNHEMVLGTLQELREHAALMKKFPEMEHADPNQLGVEPGKSGELIWKFTKAGRFDFATFVAQLSYDLNKNIHDKLKALEAYRGRLDIAINLFNSCLEIARERNWACSDEMESFDDSTKIIFSCFYSAYQYRNKFVHSFEQLYTS